MTAALANAPTATAGFDTSAGGDDQSPTSWARPGTSAQLRGTALLTMTMLGVSAINYLLNVVLARFLTPSEFGDANLLLATAAVAATLQLVAARSVAAHPTDAGAVRRSLTRWAWAVGVVLGGAMAIAATGLAELLDTSTPAIFLLIGLGLPVYFAQAVLRGCLQGELRIGRLAASYVVESAPRLGLAVALLTLGLGVTGTATARA